MTVVAVGSRAQEMVNQRMHMAAVSVLLPVLLAGQARAEPRTFTDVTVAAGVDYVHNETVQGPVGPGFIVQIEMSGGAAAGDFDGDGWTDLFVTRYDQNGILFRNQHDGTFEDATAHAFGPDGLRMKSNGAGWGDVDNDGDLDLYVTSLHADGYELYINNGAGQFTEEAAARGATAAGPDDHYGYSVSFGDYDGDGFLDLHTNEWRLSSQNPADAPSYARLLRNRGASSPGHFDDVTAVAGVTMEHVGPSTNVPVDSQSFASRFTDLDGDGLLDLIVTSDHGTSRLFWNDGDGTFTDGTEDASVGTDQFGMGSTVGDYDLDGDFDWFVTSIYDATPNRNGNRLYQNNGDRTFEDVTDAAGVRDGGWGWGTTFFDFDNDRDLDIVMTNGMTNFGAEWLTDRMRLFENEGGIFTEVGVAYGIDDTGRGKGLLTFDYDKDGDLDVFVANTGQHPVLYRNDGGNDNGWLRVQLEGIESNRQGIGARIILIMDEEDPAQALIREMDGGSNFLGQNEMIAHFGLGPNIETVDLLRIQWSSGIVQELRDIEPDRLLYIVEVVPEPTLGVLVLPCLLSLFRRGSRTR